MRGKSRNLNNKVKLWLGEDVHTKHGGGPHPSLRSVVPLVWLGQVKFNCYNFGCMAAGYSLFDIEGLRDVAVATNFGTQIAITGFV